MGCPLHAHAPDARRPLIHIHSRPSPALFHHQNHQNQQQSSQVLEFSHLGSFLRELGLLTNRHLKQYLRAGHVQRPARLSQVLLPIDLDKDSISAVLTTGPAGPAGHGRDGSPADTLELRFKVLTTTPSPAATTSSGTSGFPTSSFPDASVVEAHGFCSPVEPRLLEMHLAEWSEALRGVVRQGGVQRGEVQRGDVQRGADGRMRSRTGSAIGGGGW